MEREKEKRGGKVSGYLQGPYANQETTATGIKRSKVMEGGKHLWGLQWSNASVRIDCCICSEGGIKHLKKMNGRLLQANWFLTLDLV